MNRVTQNPRPASPSCAAYAVGACSQVACGRASGAPSVVVVVRVFPLSRARREVLS